MRRRTGLRRRLARGIARFRGDVSQNQFAKKLGISNASLNRIENGVQNVSLATLERLCDRLGCDITDLFPRDAPRATEDSRSSPSAESPPIDRNDSEPASR